MQDCLWRNIIPGRALYVEKDKIWVAQGLNVFAIDFSGKIVSNIIKLGTLQERIISYYRPIRQFLRQGIHHLIPLNNNDLFIVLKRRALLISKDGEIKSIFNSFHGNKPAHQGICIIPNGMIFFAEYSLNTKRIFDTCLYRSIDDGRTFHKILTLSHKNVRHIHFVKYDSYEKCIWIGTGDRDEECCIMRSDDYGKSWKIIGQGSQLWRSIGICFTSESIIWGTDAGSVPQNNHIVRMKRSTKDLEIIADVEGPCHGCATTLDGEIFISSGVEGGENEKDNYARLKRVHKNGNVETVLKCKKDCLPLIVQYGVIRFPLGSENSKNLVFTMMGLKSNGESIYVYER